MSRTLTSPVPVVGDLAPAALPTVRERLLPSGLRLQAVRRAGVPLVELRLRLPLGGHAGVDPAPSALLADGLFSGTTRHDRVGFASALQALGGALSASAGVERLTIAGSALAEHLDGLLELLAEVLTAPAFPPAEVERDRDRLRERLLVAASQPSRQVRDALLRRMFAGHPYGRELPTADEVSALTAGDLAALHGREVRPAGGLLVLVGDVDPDAALDRVEARLAGWAAGADDPPRTGGLAPPPPPVPGPVLLVDRPGSVQTNIRLAGPAVARDDPGYPALKLANLLFGGYFSSRLVANLRERNGYTYSPRSGIEHADAASTLTVGADVATEATAPALLEIGYELGRIASLPVEPDELAAARRYAVGSLLLSTATQAGLASMLLMLGTVGLDVTFLRDHPQVLAGVTVEDVQAAAHAHLAPARLVTVLLGDAGRVGDGVAALHPVQAR